MKQYMTYSNLKVLKLQDNIFSIKKFDIQIRILKMW